MSSAEVFGFINARKPKGITSTAFGSRVRRALGGVSIGHWGTLDPDAEGVLVLAAGKATRLLPLLGAGRKKYEFEIVLGSATDTADASGATVRSADVPADWQRRLPHAIASLIGTVSQMPPMYSAVKVAGQPLYKSARKGIDVAREPRDVEIHALRILTMSESGARLEVECDAGTYVRTLCEEIGARLGVPAHMGPLLRTAAGPFDLADAVPAETLYADARSHVVDPRTVLAQPCVALEPDQAARFAFGNAVICDAVQGATGGEPFDVLVTFGDRLVGTARATAVNAGINVQPTRVFS